MILSGLRISSNALVDWMSCLCTFHVLFEGSMFRLGLGQTDDMTIYDHILILFVSVWIFHVLLVMLACVGGISFVC